MKRSPVVMFIGVLMAICMVSGSFAAGTPEEAKKMVENAAAYYKANGKDKAIAAYNDPKGQFRKDDLFIFMLDMNGKCYAHVTLTGKSLEGLQDSDGKFFVKEQIAVAKKGSGWVDYKFTNPVTKKIQPKTSYIQKLDDTYYIGCGAFK
jgi:cytochrome c